jgi:hypothetical protein
MADTAAQIAALVTKLTFGTDFGSRPTNLSFALGRGAGAGAAITADQTHD